MGLWETTQIFQRIVSENLESWLEWREAAERPVPGYIEEELRGYLECGILCFSLRPCAVHGLRPGVCHRVLVQGKRCLPVVQRSPHGADRRPTRGPRAAAEEAPAPLPRRLCPEPQVQAGSDGAGDGERRQAG